MSLLGVEGGRWHASVRVGRLQAGIGLKGWWRPRTWRPILVVEWTLADGGKRALELSIGAAIRSWGPEP